jgi:hypothetical protein
MPRASAHPWKASPKPVVAADGTALAARLHTPNETRLEIEGAERGGFQTKQTRERGKVLGVVPAGDACKRKAEVWRRGG